LSRFFSAAGEERLCRFDGLLLLLVGDGVTTNYWIVWILNDYPRFRERERNANQD